ncbi:MAG: hypothetical protein RBU27_12295 [Bacteroidota bacterium]|jgi:hypothetical protein|nr:hypothetical protein [Bacteroidota bacterium]
MSRPNESRSSFPYSVVLIVVGALLLFGNVGWFGLDTLFGLLARWWPLIFVFRGMSRMRSGIPLFGSGIRDLLLGLVLLVIMHGLLPGNLTQLWPFVCIALGLWLIVVPRKDAITELTIERPVFNEHVLLRGARLHVASPQLMGGRLRGTVAAIECDFLPGQEDARDRRLELHALLSRVRLMVPENWRVRSELSGPANAIDDHRDLGDPPEGSLAPTLHISGTLRFSSLEITDLQ